MSKGLWVAHSAIGEFLSMLPEMVNHAVRFSSGFSKLCRLVGGYVKDLYSPGRDFDLVVMKIPMPLNGWKLSGEVFGNEVFDGDQRCLWICGFEKETLENLFGNPLAIVMEWTTWSSIRHHVRCLNMYIVADGWTGRFPTHRLLCGHPAAPDRRHRDNSQ